MSRQGPLSRPAPSASVSGVRVGLATTRSALMSGETRVVDHVEAVLDRIDAVDGSLGAYVSVAAESARRAAARADERIRRHGRAAWRRQPLLGVTVAVKDLIQTRDLPTKRGSLNRNDRAAVDAPAVARLRTAGAIVVGKTTTSEYGWSASSASRVAPATRNPWSPRHSAGGSSGGSAAAVAAGLCDVALGTDGAGSIRIPAAFCGIVGFKPTQGLIPYLPTCVNRLSHLGPMVNRVTDAAELTQFAAGGDPRDPDSLLRLPSRSRTRGPLRVAWIDFPGTDPVVRHTAAAGIEALRGLGHHVEEIDPPFTDPYLALLTILAAAEAAATPPDHEPGADAGRLAVVRHGRTLSAGAVMRAESARMRLRATMAEVMGRYDMVASCTVPVEPFAVDAIGPSWAADPEDLLWLSWAPACYPFNLTGQPAISLPVGTTRAGLPVGVQLVGPVGGDLSVLALAGRLEAELAVVAGPPPVPVMPGSLPAPDKGD